jgi:DnaK suppressor protein
MTKTELNAFRKVLECSQADLGNGNRNREALAIDASPDDLDRIQQAGERDWAMGTLERNSKRFQEVQGALRRITAGRFGICGGCEEDINLKRLAAVPWASLCIVCQEAADLEQNASGKEFDASLALAA